MSSLECERAIQDVQRVGRALIKTISANDTGSTGAHQSGYYLPKSTWKIFAPFAPENGINREHRVKAAWPDGRTTESTIKWYGTRTRSEYRFTRFGRDFPYLDKELVGSVLVLVPESADRFRMHVLSTASDIDDLEAALGIELLRGWASTDGDVPSTETEDECIERRLRAAVDALDSFPATELVAQQTRSMLAGCNREFLKYPLDDQLLECMETEFELFRRIERKVCTPQTAVVFKTIDQFIKTANSILQRRKARAGLSLENQVHALLEAARVPHDMKPVVDGTRPDIVIPGAREYGDATWPTEKLFVVGVKRTCKDRWRQVLQEAPRVDRKHLLTIQNGISASQMEEIEQAGVELIVPKGLHSFFPKPKRSQLRTLDGFVDDVRRALAR